MVLRSNRQDGHRFWGCSSYPLCRHTMALDVAMEEDEAWERAEEEQEEEETPYHFEEETRVDGESVSSLSEDL